jgi:hypothetical protein
VKFSQGLGRPFALLLFHEIRQQMLAARPDTGIPGLSISGQRVGVGEVLTPEALRLLVDLDRRFNPRRLELLAARRTRQAELDAGALPDFREDTRAVRAGDWRVAPVPADLQDRRLEITGPVDRKMIINALNAPVKAFMADFEDSTPTWANRCRAREPQDAAARSAGIRRGSTTGCVTTGGTDGPSTRLAPAREARAGRRRAGVRQPVRFRAVPRQ